MNRPSRFLLLGLAIAAGSLPAAAQSNAFTTSTNVGPAAKPFTFEVVSIHHYPSNTLPYAAMEYLPDGINLHGLSVGEIIRRIYSQPGTNSNLTTEVQNVPAWFYTDKYDIEARVAHEDVQTWQEAQETPGSELRTEALLAEALQTALKNRSKLAVHLTIDEKPCLDLVVGSHGPKLSTTVPGAVKPVPDKTYKAGDGFAIQQDGTEHFVGVTMADLAARLSRASGWQTIIQDKTGLTGRYDFTLPYYGQDPDVVGLDRMPVSDIGLALKPGKAPITVINIDHIERPDAN